MLAESETIANQIGTIDDLRGYIYSTICQREQLEPGAFPMTERPLLRRGRPCGVLFCLRGPRSLLLTAIWETDGNMVFFYGSTGERFRTTRLSNASRLSVSDFAS